MSAATSKSRDAKLRSTSRDSTPGTAPVTFGAEMARGIFSAVTTSSRSHVLKAQCVTARFVIVQPCVVVQQRGSCLDCQIGGKPLTQIARTIDRRAARRMGLSREFYFESVYRQMFRERRLQ